MTRTRFLVPIFALLALLAAAAPLLAGGWATVELDGLPAGELRPGRPVQVSFTVLQHGQTPVHTANIMNDQPLIPDLVAVNQATAESVTAGLPPILALLALLLLGAVLLAASRRPAAPAKER